MAAKWVPKLPLPNLRHSYVWDTSPRYLQKMCPFPVTGTAYTFHEGFVSSHDMLGKAIHQKKTLERPTPPGKIIALERPKG